MSRSFQTVRDLPKNSRFYILSGSIFLSILILGLFSLLIPNSQLFFIRSEQLFGLLAMVYWFVALTISPIGYLIGKQRTRHIEFSRRAIGVSAAYFAVLHSGIALFGQLGGLARIAYLPEVFLWSLGAGLMGVIVLLMMAATSFNKVIKWMTFRRWKWLHRLGYGGFILVVLHIWVIGTHLSYEWIVLAAFFSLVVLAGLESFRVMSLLAGRYKVLAETSSFMVIFLALWAIWVGLILSIPGIFERYHAIHEVEPTSTHQLEHHHEH